MTARVHTIDCAYTDHPGIAAAYLIEDRGEVAIIEANTSQAVPIILDHLAQLGHTPEDVRYVVITHIHLDHAGGAGTLMRACPNATLLAHPKAAPHAIDPTRIEKGARAVYGEVFDDLYGEIVPVPAERVRALEDGETFPLGQRTLTVLHTRGHANHHFVVHDPGADAVFTGDSFGLVYPVLQHRGLFAFPSTTPTDFDPEAAHASIERILATGAGRAFPTHFGEHRDLQGIADQLHPLLDAHADIVDRADAAEIADEALDAWCRRELTAVFDAHLEAHGMGDEVEAHAMVRFDRNLNAQGLAFSVRKRRYKRKKAAEAGA